MRPRVLKADRFCLAKLKASSLAFLKYLSKLSEVLFGLEGENEATSRSPKRLHGRP
jgi:hypothetical protein